MMIHPSLTFQFQVPPFADGPSVAIGRHGARRGVTAPVMQVSTEKLKQLRGEDFLQDGPHRYGKMEPY